MRFFFIFIIIIDIFFSKATPRNEQPLIREIIKMKPKSASTTSPLIDKYD